MTIPASFSELIARVRTGDQDAMTELVRRYEPAVRRAVRIRLFDARLRRIMESADISHAVMFSLLQPEMLEKWPLETPADMLRVLLKMARNKLISRVRRERAQRRDQRRTKGNFDGIDIAGREKTPSQQIAARELLEKIRDLLTPEELELIGLRDQKLSWAEIAAQRGGTADGVRKQLERAMLRVQQTLNPQMKPTDRPPQCE